MQEDLLVVGGALALFAVALPFLWKFFQHVPGPENLFDEAKKLGFEMSNDGRAWLRSQLPRLHIATVEYYDSHGRRRERPSDAVPLRIAKREDVDFTTVLFYRDAFMALSGATDLLVVALNPKNAAVLPRLGEAVIDRVRHDTGWLVQVHGGWLVMHREARHAVEPDALEPLLDEARHAYENATLPQPLS